MRIPVESVVVIGAGPAGLTAAYELARHGVRCDVLEADEQVGGISRTVERDGWRFDLGGHRFFTKVPRVEAFWREILTDDDFLLRPRMSRIYYNGRYFDYPLRAVNALRNLGVLEAIACIASYVAVRMRPPRDVSHFEGWVASRFGWRLYRTFFKSYTEKVWGVPADQIEADWAAQRIKNLSLGKAVTRALLPKASSGTEVTSLIEEFHYPKYGPGMLWEACAQQIQDRGQDLHLRSSVCGIRKLPGEGVLVTTRDGREFTADHVVSTMPIGELTQILNPPPPDAVTLAAQRLSHRDFLTVALVVPHEFSFPDNWIYIHSPAVQVGRIQNFCSWSPYLIKEGRTCLGLEYFVSEGDALWASDDADLIVHATHELESLGLVSPGAVEAGYVVRVPKAYPVYDAGYLESLGAIRKYLTEVWPQVHPVGRNGMHRYNNQDHSMLTAMVTVDNLVTGEATDVWQVNVDAEYHEETSRDGRQGTGRAAPVVGNR